MRNELLDGPSLLINALRRYPKIGLAFFIVEFDENDEKISILKVKLFFRNQMKLG
ncbi:hypothetical protein [Weissella coleopterorum]|uniref:hypothetical protein n=1 Tax=Weissella coleopterorum TaxID=2714949 RepID=UPI001980F0E0|nr:hypothetical protein [Weissella coleopterorum]